MSADNNSIEYCSHKFIPYNVGINNPWYGYSHCKICGLEQWSREHVLEMELIFLQEEYDAFLEKTGVAV